MRAVRAAALPLLVIAGIALSAPAMPAHAQDRGAAALANALAFLRPEVPRVLYIAAHPDDEDTRLITWLQRGGYAEVAYLSLSRGEGGQNVIGEELGDALGVLRTQELLTARRIDGADQFFTRGYDFGYSKTADEAFTHWPRDSLLADVVKIVRAYRPHVLVSTFSGTPRDAHGQHQVSGILTRDAFDFSADSVRFPVSEFGAPWQPLKVYRLATFSGGATLGVNVGEYDPLSGRSFMEIASDSRSNHKSQAYRRNARLGVVWDSLKREVTLVNAEQPAEEERSLLDGVPGAADAARWIARGTDGSALLSVELQRAESAIPLIVGYTPRDAAERRRYDRAAVLAAGIVLEALPARPYVAVGDTVTVTYTLYNRGGVRVQLDSAAAGFPEDWIEPGSAATWRSVLRPERVTAPWWLQAGRRADLYAAPVSTVPEAERQRDHWAQALVSIEGLAVPARLSAPLVHRQSEGVYGDLLTPLAVAPGLTVTPERDLWYARAGIPFERDVNVVVRSSFPGDTRATVRVLPPAGLVAEPAEREVTLNAGALQQTVTFRLRGTLEPGSHRAAIEATVGSERFATAVQVVNYEHIDPQRLYRPSEVRITAVAAEVPAGLTVGYVTGMADQGPHVLRELGVPVTQIAVADLPRVDLSRFTTVVVGPRAYEANPDLIRQNQRLFEYAAAGGRLVVQFGQYPMANPGILPFPITISRPPTRVTDERAAVTFIEPGAPELTYPNAITQADFEGWVQERGLYFAQKWGPQYDALLSSHDPGEEPKTGGLLIASHGEGRY
ncbi:MAG TPA: PIG-L family deacetylase, partial [Gemmatimonadaceae bacterium]